MFKKKSLFLREIIYTKGGKMTGHYNSVPGTSSPVIGFVIYQSRQPLGPFQTQEQSKRIPTEPLETIRWVANAGYDHILKLGLSYDIISRMLECVSSYSSSASNPQQRRLAGKEREAAISVLKAVRTKQMERDRRVAEQAALLNC